MRIVITDTSGVTNSTFTAKSTKDEKRWSKDKAFVNAHAAWRSTGTDSEHKIQDR